jgi:CD2 antigen cytoplasmic tail-binding protein 2
MDTDNNPPRKSTTTSTSNSKAVASIDRITALASEIMALGDTEVYSKTYEHFLRSVRSAGNVEPSWVPPTKKYEYKWDIPGATTAAEQIFGPFGEEELKAWYDAQYFGSVGEKVKVRIVGGEWGSWDDVVE